MFFLNEIFHFLSMPYRKNLKLKNALPARRRWEQVTLAFKQAITRWVVPNSIDFYPSEWWAARKAWVRHSNNQRNRNPRDKWRTWSVENIRKLKKTCSDCKTIKTLFKMWTTQPAKLLKSITGGVSFSWIGIQYTMPYSQKYTSPHCFFCNFAGWVSINQ